MRECSRKRPRIERTSMFSEYPFTPGTQCADAANHDLDADTGLRRPIERIDHLLVDQCVGFQPNARIGAGLLGRDLPFDPFDDPSTDAVRCDQQVAVRVLARVTGQRVEQIGEVRADVRRGRQQADVLIEACGLAVVVAGADMAVAPNHGSFAAHHETGFAVRLQPDQSVDHVHARTFQGTGPFDVGLFVEARFDFD